MERLKSGGVKKLRTSKSRLRQDENHHRGAIVMDGSIVMTAKNKNNTVAKRTRNTEKKTRMLANVDNNRSVWLVCFEMGKFLAVNESVRHYSR